MARGEGEAVRAETTTGNDVKIIANAFAHHKNRIAVKEEVSLVFSLVIDVLRNQKRGSGKALVQNCTRGSFNAYRFFNAVVPRELPVTSQAARIWLKLTLRGPAAVPQREPGAFLWLRGK